MSGETEDKVSGWTVDTLHSHIVNLMNERQQRFEQRFAAQEIAITKAEAAVEKRFDSVNEFRHALADLSQKMITRNESEAKNEAMSDKIETNAVAMSKLRDSIMATSGKSSATTNMVTAGIAITAVIVSVGLAMYSHGDNGSSEIIHQLQLSRQTRMQQGQEAIDRAQDLNRTH